MLSFIPEEIIVRAKSRLEQAEPEQLLYCALELRLFVEARQNQYLVAQQEYRRSLPKPFRIGMQARELERIFKWQKIQRVEWRFGDDLLYEFQFIPVSRTLREAAERLGEYLHYQVQEFDGERCREIQHSLSATLSLAEHCAKGNLHSPAMFSSEGTVQGKMAGVVTDEVAEKAAELARTRQPLHIAVSYHDLPVKPEDSY